MGSGQGLSVAAALASANASALRRCESLRRVEPGLSGRKTTGGAGFERCRHRAITTQRHTV
jgi:hypothetical protein